MLDTPDAVDRILIREAGPALVRARHVVVLDNESTALAAEVIDATAAVDGSTIGLYTDSAATEHTLTELAGRHPPGPHRHGAGRRAAGRRGPGGAEATEIPG